MAKFYQTKEFRSQQDQWDEKLKESGFKDTEKYHDPYRWAKFENVIEAKLEYFRIITNKVHEDESSLKPLDLTIMTMRGDGFTIKQIAHECKIHRQTVRFVIRRYEHHWGIRFWTLAQRYLVREPK